MLAHRVGWGGGDALKKNPTWHEKIMRDKGTGPSISDKASGRPDLHLNTSRRAKQKKRRVYRKG